MSLKNSFPRKIRLNNSLIIRELFKQGVYKSLGPIGVKFRKTEHETNLFAISVNKKVGNSACRNRIKRLIREAVRLEKSNLICTFDFCFFVINPPRNKMEYTFVLEKVKHLFKYLNVEVCK